MLIILILLIHATTRQQWNASWPSIRSRRVLANPEHSRICNCRCRFTIFDTGNMAATRRQTRVPTRFMCPCRVAGDSHNGKCSEFVRFFGSFLTARKHIHCCLVVACINRILQNNPQYQLGRSVSYGFDRRTTNQRYLLRKATYNLKFGYIPFKEIHTVSSVSRHIYVTFRIAYIVAWPYAA